MQVIKVNSITCTSCIIMDKIFNEINQTYNFDVINYDYDFDLEKIEKYNVGKILPVFIFLNEDKEIGRIIGEKSKDDFISQINVMIKGE